MSRLLWLGVVARAAGLEVVEISGWQERGRATMNPRPRVVVAHHTATSARAGGDLPTLRILRDGRPGLSGPLCHYGLGRSGTVYVVAAGKANHCGVGTWRGVTRSTDTIGIEAEHPGDSSPWPEAQLDAYDRLVAAILRRTGQDYRYLCAHREWARPPGRKVDPTGIDMDAMRRRVAVLMEGPGAGRRVLRLTDPMLRGEDVAELQRAVGAGVDGAFGPATRDALVRWQTVQGLVADGVCGPATWSRIDELNSPQEDDDMPQAVTWVTSAPTWHAQPIPPVLRGDARWGQGWLSVSVGAPSSLEVWVVQEDGQRRALWGSDSGPIGVGPGTRLLEKLQPGDHIVQSRGGGSIGWLVEYGKA